MKKLLASLAVASLAAAAFAEPTTVEFNFKGSDNGIEIVEAGTSGGGSACQVALGGVTLSVDNGYYGGAGKQFQVYAGAALTVAATGSISEVTLTYASGVYPFADALPEGATATTKLASGDVLTYTATYDAESVVYHNEAAGQTKLNKIAVTYVDNTPQMPELPVPACTAEPLFDGETIYYLYNVEAKGFALGDNDWKTRASYSTEKGYKWKVASTGESTYSLTDSVETQKAWKKMFCENSTSIWVDNNNGAHCDSWEITALGEGKFHISNTAAVAEGLLGAHLNGDTRLYCDTFVIATTWEFVAADQYTAFQEAMVQYAADLDAYYAAILKTNTTVGTDILPCAPAAWVGASGNYGARAERYNTAMYTGDVMTQTIGGLVPGTKYEVTLEATASYTSGRGFDGVTGLGLSGLFANEGEADIEVIDRTGVAAGDYGPYSVVGTVDEEGNLKYGIQNVFEGGNWFVIACTSIKVTDKEVTTAPELNAKRQADAIVNVSADAQTVKSYDLLGRETNAKGIVIRAGKVVIVK